MIDLHSIIIVIIISWHHVIYYKIDGMRLALFGSNGEFFKCAGRGEKLCSISTYSTHSYDRRSLTPADVCILGSFFWNVQYNINKIEFSFRETWPSPYYVVFLPLEYKSRETHQLMEKEKSQTRICALLVTINIFSSP